MNFKNFYFLLPVLLFSFFSLTAQEWVHTFPHSSGFYATLSTVAPDGGVIVTDTRRDVDSLMVVRVSPAGTVLWEKRLVDAGINNANGPIGCGGVYFEPDGSMYFINNRDAPGFNVIHIEADGDEIGRGLVDNLGWTSRTVRLANGDFMVTRVPGVGMAQVQPDGAMVGTFNPATGGGLNFTNSIAQGDNGHFMLYVNGFFQSGSNGVIIHADDQGLPVLTYSAPIASNTHNIAKGPDGNFLAVGSNDSAFWFNISPTDDILNQVVVTDPSQPMITRDVVALPDGYLVGGSKGGTAVVWRLDPSGNVMYEQLLMPAEEALITSLAGTEDSYTVYASGQVTDGAEDDVFLLKLNILPLEHIGRLEGTVRLDPESDCDMDVSEDGLSSLTVLAAGHNELFFTTTDPDGNYRFLLDTGEYDVWAADGHPYLELCGFAQPVTVSGGNTAVANFWEKELFDCPLLQVSISNNFMRRCFQNKYAVRYCNLGTAPAIDSEVKVILDPHFMYVASSFPLASSSGDTLVFNTGNLDIGECGSFTITVDMIDCDSVVFGETFCTSAHIYPDEVCGATANWSGASMKVGAECDGDSVRMYVANVGTAPTSQPIEFIITEDNVILMRADDTFNPADTTWSIKYASGTTWRVESEQEPFHPSLGYPIATLEGCDENADGMFSTGFVSTLPQNDEDFAHEISCSEVIASYDPNAKSAFPSGVDAAHFIEQNVDIEYLLQFQNTGNDTAFTVVLRDTLPLELDPMTIQIGAASHPFTWTLQDRGELVFRFDNILLPDSTTNEVESNGWVSFRISQQPDLPLGTVIENSVAIYFDFNEAVITNTAFHTVEKDFLMTVLPSEEQFIKGVEVAVHPNPFYQQATFEIKGKEVKEGVFELVTHVTHSELGL